MSWRTEGMGNTVGNAEDSEYAGHVVDHAAAEASQDHGRLWKTTEDCAVLQEGKDVAGLTEFAEDRRSRRKTVQCCRRARTLQDSPKLQRS